MPETSRCRSCQAKIRWVESAVSRAILPLDYDPVPDGNIVLEHGKAVIVGPPSLFVTPTAGPRYRSHFATCPKAAAHRRGGKADGR